MTDRSLVYRLEARIAGFATGMRTASKLVKDVGDQANKADAKGEKFRRGLTDLGNTAGKVGLIAGAGLGAAVVAAANFDAAMSKVDAATHESAANMELLRAAAIKAGADTVFSATEAAQAIEEMAKAGISTRDILAGGLDGALNLAAAGSLDVARAAEIAATAMNQFQLGGDQVNHVADLLAAAAGKASGDVNDLGFALKYAGVPANSLGVSIEETTAVLGEFASAGILGEQAGTTLRGILVSLASASGPAQKAMDNAGLSFYDASGKFIGLAAAAGELQDKLGGVSEAARNNTLVKIFGRESLPGAIKLYEGGAAAVQEWTDKVNDSGYAADTASRNLNNLRGDLEQFRGSLETALIGTGEGSMGTLRVITQGLTAVVNAYNSLPAATKGAASAMLAATSALGGGAFLGARTITGIANARRALKELGETGARVRTAISGVGKAAGAAFAFESTIIAISALQQSMDELLPTTEELTTSLLNLRGFQGADLGPAFDDLADSIDRLTDKSAGEAFGDTMEKIFTAGQLQAGSVREASREIESLDAALSGLVDSGGPDRAKEAFSQMTSAQGLSGDQTERLLDVLPRYRDALAGVDNQTKVTAESTRDVAQASSQHADAERDTAKAIAAKLDAMKKEKDANLSAFDAETRYAAAIDDARAALKENGATLDENTEKGRANRDALSEVASGFNGLSDAAKNAPGAYKKAIDTFAELAGPHGMGLSIKAARALARDILNIPPRTVEVKVETRRAKRNIDTIKAALREINHNIDIDVNVRPVLKAAAGFGKGNGDFSGGLTGLLGGGGGGKPRGGLSPEALRLLGALGMATGGPVRGPGSGTSDSIPAWLSNGEYVINAKATARHRQLLEQINANRYASGGYVGSGGGAFPSTVNLSAGDIAAVAQAVASARSVYGDVYVYGDGSFEREARNRQAWGSTS